MPIDHAGTKPGLTPQEEAPNHINLRCKNVGCDSITAIELPSPGPGLRMYQCVKCKMTRGVNVGGAIYL